MNRDRTSVAEGETLGFSEPFYKLNHGQTHWVSLTACRNWSFRFCFFYLSLQCNVGFDSRCRGLKLESTSAKCDHTTTNEEKLGGKAGSMPSKL
ncbi:unnamed protein product [Sphenostylis stenocarpa]|uniref:Uncharacterized protein n=1 Tax=Sphenostylis stenocarpa TaxID=92480 RepID=A0AA86VFS5_9FABA|nr:unnamed protein product [Sphenostylis stenocarpa]